MSYWKHDLLPAHVQHLLIDAAKLERQDLIQRAIERAHELVPGKFYKEGDHRLEKRIFYNQPADGRVPMAGYIIPKKGTT